MVGLEDTPRSTCIAPPLTPPVIKHQNLHYPCFTLSLWRGKQLQQLVLPVQKTVMDDSSKTPVKYTDGVKEDSKAVEAAPSAQESAEVSGNCLWRTRRLIPARYRNELVQLFKLAGPVVRRSTVTRVLYVYF